MTKLQVVKKKGGSKASRANPPERVSLMASKGRKLPKAGDPLLPQPNSSTWCLPYSVINVVPEELRSSFGTPEDPAKEFHELVKARREVQKNKGYENRDVISFFKSLQECGKIGDFEYRRMHDVKTLNQLIFSERFETGDMVIMVGIAVKSNLRAQAVKPMMKEFKKAVGTNTFDSKNQLHLRTATRVYTNDIPNTVHQKNVQGNGWHAVGTYSTFLLLNPPPRKRQRPSPINGDDISELSNGFDGLFFKRRVGMAQP
mmetsp:Transcript_18811/g.31495  ORF Transcript_18811/g.31495 Transcript_18811/m.31495 type:complete len:258 (+) Transcript_18811:315-1088(+)